MSKKLLMNKYYYDLINSKLKKDIETTLISCNKQHEELIKQEIKTFFFQHKINFEEENITTGTHQVRDRGAYQGKCNRCIALVWNEGHGGQCSRSKNKDYGDFCKQHFKKGDNEWWLGTIKKRIERPVDSRGKIHIWLEK